MVFWPLALEAYVVSPAKLSLQEISPFQEEVGVQENEVKPVSGSVFSVEPEATWGQSVPFQH